MLVSRRTVSLTIFVTVALSARSACNVQTEPPRSTSATTARLFDGPASSLGKGQAACRLGADDLGFAEVGFVRLDRQASATHRPKRAVAHGLADAVRKETS